MIQDIEEITYQGGLLERGQKPENLEIHAWRGEEIPHEWRKQI